MPTALCVTVPLLLAAVLVASAVGKLRAPDRARDAFTAMGVPSWLNRPIAVRAHPWAEVALAAALLVVPGPLGVVVAAAVLLLMLVYVALVVRALRSPVDVDCACFGSIGSDRVTGLTVWRNAWLSALAGIALWCSFEGRSAVARLGGFGAGEWWWLGALVATAVTVGLVLSTGEGTSERTDEATGGVGDDEYLEDDRDYLRSRTPAVPVLLGDGSRTNLRELSAQKAQLLVFVSEACAPCLPVIEAVPTWREQLQQIDVRYVVQVGPDVSRLTSPEEPRTLHDVDGLVKESFGTRRTPSAILLGADGLLAGGPVVGGEAVPDFIVEIREQLTG